MTASLISEYVAAALLIVSLTGCDGGYREHHLDNLRAQRSTCEAIPGSVAVPMVDSYGRIHYFKCEQKR